MFGLDKVNPSSLLSAATSSIGVPGPISLDVPLTFFDEVLAPAALGLLNEEELFAGLVDHQIGELLGKDLQGTFRSLLGQAAELLGRGDGYLPVEQMVLHVLDQMVKGGVIEAAHADGIYSSAFLASQLDDNGSALFDGRGSAGDDSVTTMNADSAFHRGLAALGDLAGGRVETKPMRVSDALSEITAASQDRGVAGGSVDQGFLWKPESEGDGNLVILLPPGLTGEVTGLTLVDSDGNVIDRGRDAGIANGGREHFRFERPGSNYPSGVTVRIQLSDGTVREVPIENPGRRQE